MSKLPDKPDNKLNVKKRDRNEKQKASQKRRRLINGLKEWNARPKPSKPYIERVKYETIMKQMKIANQQNLNIISIDCEMITLYDGPDRFSNKSLWVVIIDTNKKLLYESLVKFPKSDIKQLNTRFHGIELHHLKYAIGNNQNRETCLDFLACCDYVIGCNIKSDLAALSLSSIDILKLGHKLIDIGTAFNP